MMVDVLTTAIYLGIRAFNGPVLAALLILGIAIAIMILLHDVAKKTACQYNLPAILQLQNDTCEQLVSNTGVQLMNVTCGQLLTSLTL